MSESLFDFDFDNLDPETVQALETFSNQVKGLPGFSDVIRRLESGDLTPEGALAEMAKLLQENSESESRFMEIAGTLMVPGVPNANGDLFFVKEKGLPMMNPLVQGALVERAQYDGDMPEMRTGPMEESLSPSVSVATDVVNPVMLGRMLEAASEQIKPKVLEAHAGKMREIGDLVESPSETQALQRERALDSALTNLDPSSDAEVYRRGGLPAPVSVTTPTGSELMLMSELDRKRAAWRFFSTSQGRRSAVGTIAVTVYALLQSEGINVQVRDFDGTCKETVHAFHEWKADLSGPNGSNPSFDVIGTAAKAIAKKLSAAGRGDCWLEVTQILSIDQHKVGWAGRLIGDLT